MRYGWIVFSLIFMGAVITAFCLTKESHRFSENECSLCHLDIEKNPAILKTMSSSICDQCHLDSRQKLSHPVDILPKTPLPADMLLENGMLSCITCHFVHPFSIKHEGFSYFLLRRPGKGAPFCSTCHKINEKGHMVFENVHMGSYQVTELSGSLDSYTLQCIECHDDKIDKSLNALGAGKWQHFSASKLNHSIGVSYVKLSARNPKDFNRAGILPQEIRLFDGKIGCGTCHNAYSKEKFMLVVNNWKSRLCLECHIK